MGVWAKLNGHRLTISDQEQAWCLENRVDAVQQQCVVQARWDRGKASPSMLGEQAEVSINFVLTCGCTGILGEALKG